VIVKDKEITEEFVGYFKNGLIFNGSYKRKNEYACQRYNNAIEEFNEQMSLDKNSGFLYRWEGTGGRFLSGKNITSLEKIREFVDVEYQGIFIDGVPCDRFGNLTLRSLQFHQLAYSRLEDKPKEYTFQKVVPVMFSQRFIATAEKGSFLDGKLFQYYENEFLSGLYNKIQREILYGDTKVRLKYKFYELRNERELPGSLFDFYKEN
jgi:hypothetical protein